MPQNDAHPDTDSKQDDKTKDESLGTNESVESLRLLTVVVPSMSASALSWTTSLDKAATAAPIMQLDAQLEVFDSDEGTINDDNLVDQEETRLLLVTASSSSSSSASAGDCKDNCANEAQSGEGEEVDIDGCGC